MIAINGVNLIDGGRAFTGGEQLKNAYYNGGQIYKGEVMAESITAPSGMQSVKIGKTLQIKATVLPEDTKDKTLAWRSTNEAVASVDQNGLATGNKSGLAIIIATTINGKSKTISVQVSL